MASFEYPRVWETTERVTSESGGKKWLKIKEPISGDVVFGSIDIEALPVTVSSVDEFGRPEDNKFLKIVAGDDKELQQADLMGVATRVDDKGIKYYEYKLAYSPSKCSYEESRKFWGTCPIKTLAYVSTAVMDGKLYKFTARTNLEEWGNFAKQQPAVWQSFTVGPLSSS